MDYVRDNVRLLRECADVLRKHDLAAAFQTHEPFFMPEAFFAAHPRLRGARLDHPRRTCQEAFGICRDTPEGQQMLAYSMSQLMKEVPELTDLYWLTNDAGAGMCWCEHLYPGPNGPDHCRRLGTGQHVANVLAGFDRGSGDRKQLDIIVMHGNFTQAERQLIPHYIDRQRVFWTDFDDRVVRVGPVMEDPVLGILDPVAMLAAMERATRPDGRKICIDLGTTYKRSYELPEAAEKVFEIVEAYLDAPATGTIGRLAILGSLCRKWVAPEQADDLLEALVAIHEAYQYKRAALPRFGAMYVGVSMRHMTRPLVAMPEKLSPEEESYFLPYVFNPDPREARMDYLDFHGGRLIPATVGAESPDPPLGEVARACSRFNGVAGRLEKIEGEGDAAFFRNMAISLRIYASIIRSIGNFCAMQIVRDRNAWRFAAGPRTPSKVFSMTGDPDLLLIHEYMRDELDNTSELIDLLDKGGMERLITSRRAGLPEDTFLLGADIADQLRRKMAIMRRHWLDASAYLATPLK
jgi:hypothetical protein